MDPSNTTLNEGGESSAPIQTGGLISTTDFVTSKAAADTEPEGANNTEGADTNGPAKDGQGAAGAAGKKTEGEDADLTRFDKHPRFQELRTKAEAAEKRAIKLESQVSKLMEATSKKTSGEKGADDLPYKDTSKMTAEQLLDWQSEDPHGYYKNVLEQAKHEVNQDFDHRLEAKNSEDAIVTEYQTFAEQHPDFDGMWEDGTLPGFMDKHPGHNAISAYLVLSGEKRTQEAVDKAVAAAEKKFATNQRAKRESRSLGAGPQTTGSHGAPVDAELQDSKKFGGTTRVLANRLRALRQRQSGA